jgi:hypothetical protein
MFRLVSKRVAFAANSSESSWRALAQPLVFNLSARFMSKERAGKAVKPGAALVIDGAPHKVLKITQGKRGKGGGYVRYDSCGFQQERQLLIFAFTVPT